MIVGSRRKPKTGNCDPGFSLAGCMEPAFVTLLETLWFTSLTQIQLALLSLDLAAAISVRCRQGHARVFDAAACREANLDHRHALNQHRERQLFAPAGRG